MSKQDVIDYVMETPHNTNRAVLEGLVDTAVEESQVQADWDQNDPKAKDYIKNRPGGYFIHAPVLGISEDITLDAISATSAEFYITFIGEDDDESFDKYDETLILHFFGKEIPISYNATRGYYAVYETLNGITIGVINDNYYDKKITWSVTYSIEKKSILTPSDFYITKKSSVPFANAIMPQANQNAFGALKPYCYDETDENYPYDDYQQCYQVLSSGEQNGRLTTKKQVRSYYKLTPDIILNSCFYADEGDFIANFRGASDEIKNLLGVQDVDFPILMYHKDTVYNSERPTYTLSIITQTGKHGTFTCNRSTKEMTPITWTFEGGGGNSLFIITATYNSDTKTWSTDRTWDEVKEALAKSENPNDYAMSFNEGLVLPNTLNVLKNSRGEITDVCMDMASVHPIIFDKNMVPEGFGGAVPVATYVTMSYHANSSVIKLELADSGEIGLPIIRSVMVTKSNNETLVCDPTNTVELFAELFVSNNPTRAQFICPLYYNGETYHFETGEKDSSNIISFYFSTVSNGIYKRLKITQGQNGAADTVVMDKEIRLNDEPLVITLSNDRGQLYANFNAETICNAAASGRRVLTNNGQVLVHYNVSSPANDKKYWMLFAGSSNAQTASNGFVATEIYCNDVAGSFNGPWNQHYISDLTNPLGLRNSQVGQIAEISGVDSNGKPTSWKTVDVLTTTNTAAFTPTADYHPATKKYVDNHTPSKISKLENDSNYITAAHVYDGILISSSTPNSTKKFKITVDDTGALTATGITEA
jgi:hypothetical protein|nr:MAG TPA: hypothetical protein [Caudoviricetes sp.]